MTVGELIELLKKAPLDDIIVVNVGSDKATNVSDILTTSDVLIGNGSIEGITYLEIEPYEN